MSGEIVRSDRHYSDNRNIKFESSYWVSELIDNIGRDHFFPWIAKQLKNIVPHEFCIIFLYRDGQGPSVLFDGLSPLGHGEGLLNFLESTYEINPFYNANRNDLNAGLHRMDAFCSPSFPEAINDHDFKIHYDQSEEIGYRTQGWPQGMQELILVVPLGPDQSVEISLSQSMQARSEEAPLFDRSQQLVPTLISSIKKHCEMLRGGPTPINFQALDQQGAGDLLPARQFKALTARERGVVQLVLAGHTSESIGLCLDIAVTTVKAHRRNIYRKLGISSQAELFLLAMKKILH